MPTQTLSKNERLKSYKRIRILFAEGEKFRVNPLLVYYRLHMQVEGVEDFSHVPRPLSPVPCPPSLLQMGVSVSSRYFKRAVDRNLLKRRIREAYRKQKMELKELLHEKALAMDVFFVYIDSDIKSYEIIQNAVSKALNNLCTHLTSNI